MMIVVRPGLQGLGAVPDPLGAKVTIPGFGIRVSVRDVLIILCNTGKLNKTLCEYIKFKPQDACNQLVSQGDAWLTSQLEGVIKGMINKTMALVDCKASNWKDIVKASFTVNFSDEGISVDFDPSALIQSTICAAVNKSINLSFKPVVNLLVKNLKAACAKLGPTPSGSSSSSSTVYTPPASTGGFSPGAVINRVQNAIEDTVQNVKNNQAKQQTTKQVLTVYSVPKTPGVGASNNALVWGGVGVALAGVTWFALSRR